MAQLAAAQATPPAAAGTVASVIASELRPLVRRIDEQGYYPAEVMRALGAAGAFGHHAAGPDGGDLYAAVEAMSKVSEACVSTGFCMWCQDALVWYLASSSHAGARSRYLADAASGRLLGGTGLSNPMKALAGFEPLALKGVRVADGYRVTGRLPYVSNLGAGHAFAGIFSVDGDSQRLAMAVFRAGEANVSFSQNAHFIGLEGTATYSVQVRDSFVPDDHVLSDDATAFVPWIRKGFVLLQCGFGLGSARGSAAALRNDSVGRRFGQHLPLQPDAIDERCDALAERIKRLCAEPQKTDRTQFLEVLRARLDVSWLALEAAQTLMIQAGVRGYLAGSEASRRLREAQFVAVVTPSVKHICTELARGDGTTS